MAKLELGCESTLWQPEVMTPRNSVLLLGIVDHLMGVAAQKVLGASFTYSIHSMNRSLRCRVKVISQDYGVCPKGLLRASWRKPISQLVLRLGGVSGRHSHTYLLHTMKRSVSYMVKDISKKCWATHKGLPRFYRRWSSVSGLLGSKELRGIIHAMKDEACSRSVNGLPRCDYIVRLIAALV